VPDVGLYAQVACIWEATARKPGNVTPYHSFEDLTYLDFLMSAAAIAPVMATACQRGVGATVLEAVRSTAAVAASNTNLGIILLLAPLAAVPPGQDLQIGVQKVLAGLTVEASRLVYEAIRMAAPGGLGKAPEQDIHLEPTRPLGDVMALAAPRDLVARQYVDGFAEVFDDGLTALLTGLQRTGCIEGAIITAHLQLMASHPDSLIGRKCGHDVAQEAALRAREVLDDDWPRRREARTALEELDTWLRADGNARNPGTTADLVTACLFSALRQGHITLPLAYPWIVGPAKTP
jgi:triphosphoribosyl-dephospho-CoA synthase